VGTPFSKREELRLAMNNDILAEQLPALQADDFMVYIFGKLCHFPQDK
jgi:hypothetical protein